jgi:hypothetical protein
VRLTNDSEDAQTAEALADLDLDDVSIDVATPDERRGESIQESGKEAAAVTGSMGNKEAAMLDEEAETIGATIRIQATWRARAKRRFSNQAQPQHIHDPQAEEEKCGREEVGRRTVTITRIQAVWRGRVQRRRYYQAIRQLKDDGKTQKKHLSTEANEEIFTDEELTVTIVRRNGKSGFAIDGLSIRKIQGDALADFPHLSQLQVGDTIAAVNGYPVKDKAAFLHQVEGACSFELMVHRSVVQVRPTASHQTERSAKGSRALDIAEELEGIASPRIELERERGTKQAGHGCGPVLLGQMVPCKMTKKERIAADLALCRLAHANRPGRSVPAQDNSQ